MKLPPIDPKRFYCIGKWCFFIIAIMSLAGWIDALDVMRGIDVLKQLGLIIFNFALFGFFSYMYNQETIKNPDLSDEELKALSSIIDTTNLKKKKK